VPGRSFSVGEIDFAKRSKTLGKIGEDFCGDFADTAAAAENPRERDAVPLRGHYSSISSV
jgi:hypothetical protein